jgi:hypothetical protein
MCERCNVHISYFPSTPTYNVFAETLNIVLKEGISGTVLLLIKTNKVSQQELEKKKKIYPPVFFLSVVGKTRDSKETLEKCVSSMWKYFL